MTRAEEAEARARQTALESGRPEECWPEFISYAYRALYEEIDVPAAQAIEAEYASHGPTQ